jgi:hypothetical protein
MYGILIIVPELHDAGVTRLIPKMLLPFWHFAILALSRSAKSHHALR